jgi:lipopolysaccharide transport system permease protein
MELKARYKGRFLGYLWAVGTPFALAFVYWIVFKIIMRLEMDNYSVFLVTGLFPWTWLSVSVVSAARTFVINASLVKEVGLTHSILPLSNVIQEMAHFAFALPLLLAWVVLAGGYALNPSWIWQIPLMMIVQAAFVYPLALACALANAYIRDVEYLLGILFPVLFFATPMVYPISMVPEPLHQYFELNPLHALMQSWRSVFFEGALDTARITYAAAFSVASGAIARFLYRKLEPRISEVV